MFPSFESASLIQLAHDMPAWATGSIKTLFAVPFAFHTYNGIRHLAWDTGYGEFESSNRGQEVADGTGCGVGLSLKGVYAGGYTVIAATAVSTVYLVFFA